MKVRVGLRQFRQPLFVLVGQIVLVFEEQIAQPLELCSFIIVSGIFLSFSSNLVDHVMQILDDMEAVCNDRYIRKDGMDCGSIVGPEIRCRKGKLAEIDPIRRPFQPGNQ